MTSLLLEAARVRSLVWRGDELVDLAAGGARYALDGSTVRAGCVYSYRFDAAVGTADGAWTVLYERLGTKALLLRDGDIVRELDRSFYHASAYEYPVCIFERGGRVLVAHCPLGYERLDIDDAETGERLTAGERSPPDFFHSRLQVSPDGGRLLSAGWVWHPFDMVKFFDVDAALAEPAALDAREACTTGQGQIGLAEEGTACWQSDTRLLLGASADEEEPEDVAEASEPRLQPCGIAVYDVEGRACQSQTLLEQPPGTMMPVGDDHVVGFFDHPRLIELGSGRVEAAWPELSTGRQTSSIIHHLDPCPPLALDPANRRFAVATPDGIHVVLL